MTPTTSLALVLALAKGDKHGRGNQRHWIACDNGGLNLWETPLIKPDNDDPANIPAERRAATTAAQTLNEQLWRNDNLQWHHLMPVAKAWYSDVVWMEIFYLPMILHADMLKPGHCGEFVPLDHFGPHVDRISPRTFFALDHLPAPGTLSAVNALMDSTQLGGPRLLRGTFL